MKLVEFFSPAEIALELRAQSKDTVLAEMVDLLKLGTKERATLLQLLQKRERLGSTGIGSGVAIPHARSLAVDRLRIAFGRASGGIDFGAMDNRPVHYLFLIAAPPMEVSNLYLPVLGRIAQFCKSGENIEKLAKARTPQEILALLERAEI
jgi:PTS system nitrogen regulatory IIA component